jgi:hypothetical protein
MTRSQKHRQMHHQNVFMSVQPSFGISWKFFFHTLLVGAIQSLHSQRLTLLGTAYTCAVISTLKCFSSNMYWSASTPLRPLAPSKTFSAASSFRPTAIRAVAAAEIHQSGRKRTK